MELTSCTMKLIVVAATYLSMMIGIRRAEEMQEDFDISNFSSLITWRLQKYTILLFSPLVSAYYVGMFTFKTACKRYYMSKSRLKKKLGDTDAAMAARNQAKRSFRDFRYESMANAGDDSDQAILGVFAWITGVIVITGAACGALIPDWGTLDLSSTSQAIGHWLQSIGSMK
jgi:hypothetical protein